MNDSPSRRRDRDEGYVDRAKDRSRDAAHRGRDAVDRATEVMHDKIAEAKPRLRGWLHSGSLPVMTAAFAVLIVLSPTTETRVGSSVFAAGAILLFTVSGIYHRGTWSPRTWAFLRRFDHANIFIFIAATYTPFAFLYLDGAALWTLLGIVWTCALVGTAFKIAWPGAPRWTSMLYVAMGWLVVFFIPQMRDGASAFPTWVNVSALSLIAAGGIMYTVGAVVYALKRPDPAPEWFGFHEVFHALTVAAFVCQYTAVSIATYSLR